jgi:EmrB/QacA subfamily drug resistance transporter
MEASNSKRDGYLVLAAMIFAVAMTFIDQTIVSISVPEIQKELGLTETGVQWIINGYLLTLAALFAFGGKVADVFGRRKMVVVGVVIFAVASALCGATPSGSIAEAWMITFRLIQGAGAAIMFPAALAIIMSAFPIERRGQAVAIFFGITGALTSVGPIAGGYLTEIDWRAIFWVNIPVAIIALVLIGISKPEDRPRHQKVDYRGAVLISIGMGLTVLGFQQSANWGWSNPLTWGAIVLGLIVLALFVRNQLNSENPLLKLEIFRDRAFAANNAILFLLSIAFVPLFFFASTYAQISLGDDPSDAGLYLLVFFAGFGLASQWGGKILDTKGARHAVVPGSIIAAVGFYFWATKLTEISPDGGGLGAQWPFIVIAGIGLGLVLSPASTDAINRAPNTSYGEATGITQTVRNFSASLGLAVLGTLLLTQNKSNIETSLAKLDISTAEADKVAQSLSQSGGGDRSQFAAELGSKAEQVFGAVQLDYAMATRSVFYVMAGVMAVCFVVALLFSPPGKMEEVLATDEELEGEPGAPRGSDDR